MAASVMSAPASLVMAKIMFPETEEPETKGDIHVKFEKTTVNVIEAAAAGAADGLKLALNVAAMLMAFIALIAMLNWLLGQIHEGLSLSMIFSYVFAPIALVMGVEPKDAMNFGSVLGTQISVNEFVAYIKLAELKESLSPRSFTIATYAMCGFANFSSIAIQIGGISTIAPERRHDLARLGLRAMIAGALASYQTATIAGVLIGK
jgi:CNT family concentrative nucleoside transporter